MPFAITEEDKQSEQYEQGVSCPRCFGTHSEEQLERFREREKQVQLAKLRGESHIGEESAALIEKRRAEKLARKAAQRGQKG